MGKFPVRAGAAIESGEKYKVEGLIFLSGDRYTAEINEIQIKGISHPVFEITSSGLTHTWREYKEEPNQYRTGDLIAKLKFGILNFDWQADQVEVETRFMVNWIHYFLKKTSSEGFKSNDHVTNLLRLKPGSGTGLNSFEICFSHEMKFEMESSPFLVQPTRQGVCVPKMY